MDGVGLPASGTLAYSPGATSFQLVLAGGGSETPVRVEPAAFATPRFSPDGRRIAVSAFTKDGGADIWVHDRVANTFARLTTKGVNTAPEWSPDGRRVLYKSAAKATEVGVTETTLAGQMPRILWVPVDGSAKADTLYGLEVDFVVYGESAFFAIEVKNADKVRPDDLRGLRAFVSE